MNCYQQAMSSYHATLCQFHDNRLFQQILDLWRFVRFLVLIVDQKRFFLRLDRLIRLRKPRRLVSF